MTSRDVERATVLDLCWNCVTNAVDDCCAMIGETEKTRRVQTIAAVVLLNKRRNKAVILRGVNHVRLAVGHVSKLASVSI